MNGPRIQHYDRMQDAVLKDPMYYQHRNEQNAELRMAMRDAAALGYTLALRDLTAADWGLEWPARFIRRFAAEHGITLEDN